MNKKNNFIVKCIIIVIFIIMVLFVILKNNNGKIDNEENGQSNEQVNNKNTSQGSSIDQSNVTEDGIIKLTSYSEYFAIDDILNMYISYLQYLNGDAYIDVSKYESKQEGIEKYKEYGIEYLNTVIDENYISELSVDNEHLYEIANKYATVGDYSKTVNNSVIIYDVDIWQTTSEKRLYLISYAINGEESNLLIKLNTSTNLYTLFLEDYIEKNTNNGSFDYDKVLNTSFDIQESFYREFNLSNTTNEVLAEKYFYVLKQYLISDSKKLYDMLDEEYSKKRFADYNSYSKYIQNNSDYLNNMSLSKYKISQSDGYDNYTLLDDYNNCYSLSVNLNNIVDFSAQLDDYTIKNEEFISTYESLSEEEKAQTDIEIFFKMINLKDYESAYNLLDDTYKANNFATLEDFEQYAKEFFFDNTTITELESITKSSSYYVCMFYTSSNDEKTQLETFVVSLEEGTNFKMSFTKKVIINTH